MNNTGLSATGFGTPGEFWEVMKTEKPELLLLDIMLPEEDGISILKKLRSKSDTKDLPVIMLTAKGTEYEKWSVWIQVRTITWQSLSGPWN